MDIVRHQVNPYPRAGSLPPVESLASLEGGIIAALGSQLAVAGYTQQVVFDAEAIAPA